MAFKKIKYSIMIPARYASSRLPGKPLVDICGKTMIQHVWEKCCKVVNVNDVYVVTDDNRIANEVSRFGGKFLMTTSKCETGPGRVAEANIQLEYDFVINVQGDEPMINPLDIKKVIESYIKNPGTIINCFARIDSEGEYYSKSVPKIVMDDKQYLLYASRAPIPHSKSGNFEFGYKQVCIYAFSSEHLNFFVNCSLKKPIEALEDIEILRFLESGYKVKMLEVSSGTLAVDTPQDLEKVRTAVKLNC